MAFNFQSIITDGVAGVVKSISDVAHSWITTNKDKQIDEIAEKEFEFKVQEAAAAAQQKFIEEANAAQAAEDVNITDRWKSDMTSDSFLSKNARPLVLLYSWILLTVILVASFFKVNLPDSYLPLILTLFAMVNGAYFGSRWSEKIATIKSVNKKD